MTVLLMNVCWELLLLTTTDVDQNTVIARRNDEANRTNYLNLDNALKIDLQNMKTSREHILAAINHQKSDKVPIDMGATPSSGISAIAYSNLLKHLGRTDLPVLVYDVVQQLAQPDMSILDQFGIDVLDIGRSFNHPPSDWIPTPPANGTPTLLPKMVQAGKAGGWFIRHLR